MVTIVLCFVPADFLLSYGIAIYTSVKLSEDVHADTTLAIDNVASFAGFLYKALFILEVRIICYELIYGLF